MSDLTQLQKFLERPKARDVFERWLRGEFDPYRLRKCIERKYRNIPDDRVVPSTKENRELLKDGEDILILCAIAFTIAEDQARELQAYEDAAAEGMEIHKGDTE